MIGKIFDRLVVIERVLPNDKHKQRRWLCRCVCGKEITTTTNCLNTGNTSSCGCKSRENTIARNKTKPNKKPLGVANRNLAIRGYKRCAKKRGFVYELTDEQFIELTSSNCYYCGINPAQVMDHPNYNGAFIYNGIDRKENSIGYTVENCVPCCGVCNRAKSDMTWESWLFYLKILKNYRGEYDSTDY